MVDQLAVLAPGGHGRLERVVRLVIVLVERENAAPACRRPLRVVHPLLRPREALEHGSAPVGPDPLGNPLKRLDPCRVVARHLGDSLQRAPALEGCGVELAGLDERAHRSSSIPPALAALGDLHPAVRSLRRR